MRTLLIDGDVVAYQAAAKFEEVFDWGDGIVSITLDPDAAKKKVLAEVEWLVDELQADDFILCLTDGENWRKAILPTYKMNRADKPKPQLLPQIRQYILDNFKSYLRPTLEGDDVMGILATHPTLIQGEKVIVSIDKDFKTIEGLFYNPNKPEEGAVYYSKEEADMWHLKQTLMGDAVDGYKGCPDVGKVAAEEWAQEPFKWVMKERTITRGKNKGEIRQEWFKEPLEDGETLWDGLVSFYVRQGLTEADALIQARVARICRAEDYDFKKKEVILWQPERRLK